MRSLHLLLFLALGCSGPDKGSDDDTDTTPGDTDDTQDTDDTDTDDTDVEPCAATVVAVTPGNGDTAPADTTIVAEFSEAIGASDHVDFIVTGSGGAVTGSVDLASDGASATFTPSATLDYDATYDVTIELCEGSVSGAFHTLPAPIDPTLAEGRTYGLPYADVVFIEPQNTTALAALLAPDFEYILLQVDQVDDVALTFESVVATADGALAPNCAAAVRAPTSDMSNNPQFQVGPTNLVYPFPNGDSMNLQMLTVDGRFSQDGESLLDVYLRGLVDPSEVNDDLNCATAALLTGGTCLPCPATAGSCLLIEAEVPVATWMQGVDVVATCAL